MPGNKTPHHSKPWPIILAALACLAVLTGWSTDAKASHYRGGNIYYENLGVLGGTSPQATWIVIKATLEISQRRTAHCSSTIPTTQGGTVPHTQTCCTFSASDPTPCIGRWRSVGGSFSWTAGGMPHPTLSVSTPAYQQPANQTNDTFSTTYFEVIDENTSANYLDFRLVLYRIYPPTTTTATLTWGSCCWVGGVNGASGSFQVTTVAQVSTGNRDPIFNSPLYVVGCGNFPLSYNLNPSDPDKDDVEVVLTPTTNGADQQSPPLTVSKAGVINWATPRAGSWAVKVTAYDLIKGTTTRKGASTFRDTLLEVRATCTNKAPIVTFTTPDAVTVKPGQQACVDVVVSDPDAGDKVSVRVTPAKPGATVTPATALNPNQTPPVSFKYCWTPALTDEGTTHNILFTGTDNGLPNLTGQKSFAITVSRGGPPVITVAPAGTAKEVDEGGTIVFTATASDADTSIASFNAKLPSFCVAVRISATQFEITCKPGFTDGNDPSGSKTYDIEFDATDVDGIPKTTKVTVKLKVNNVNRAPAFTSTPPTTGTPEIGYTYTAQATDPDGDAVTYKKTKGPGTINPTTGKLDWTPGVGDAGKDFDFEIEACDVYVPPLCTKQTWTVKVGKSNAPPQIVGTPPTNLQAGQTLTYGPGVRDRDLPNDTHKWSLVKGPTGATVDPVTGALNWKPGPADAGKEFEISVRVCDAGGLCATQTWKIRVTTGNNPPVIVGTPPTTVDKGKSYSYSPGVRDADPDDKGKHTWKLDKGPSSASIDPKTGQIFWTPSASDDGKTFEFSITVCDPAGACATQTWKVKVDDGKGGNKPPTITSTPGSKATDSKVYAYDIKATDPDQGDTLTYTLEKGPTGMVVDPTTGKLTWTPGTADVGKTIPVSVKVCDKAGDCATQTWDIKVEKDNHPPQINGAPGNFASTAKDYTANLTVTDPDPEDAGKHTWKIKSAPPGATIDPSTGAIKWRALPTDVGKTVEFEVEVCDPAGACATRKWQVLVTNGDINNPPVITSTPGTQANPGADYKYPAQALDPDQGDKLTWKLKSAPTGATVDPNTGEVSWSPTAADAGKSAAFEIEVCDQSGACDTQSWSVSVGAGNQAPAITSTPPTEAFVGEKLTYKATVADADAGDTHTWTLKNGPAGATIDPTTGELTWTPAAADADKEHDFEIEVCDNAVPKACATQRFKVKAYNRCRVDSQCPQDQICANGKCFDPGCATKSPKCPTQTDFCKDGACTPNPCDTKTCGTDEICRPSDGKCIKPCAGVTCATGEKCVDGTCEKDPCATAGATGGPCAADEVCDATTDPQAPTCIKDPCATGTCKHGRVCTEGMCIDDPCPGMKCPKPEQRCFAGQCIGREPCQVDVDCDGKQVCIGGLCYPPGCYDTPTAACTAPELCLSANCKKDPCDGNQCGADEFCRRSDGKCIKPCAGVVCKTEEKCVDGACVADPCVTANCSAGETCVEDAAGKGVCEKERCNASGVCKAGRVCVPTDNECQDDPCANVTCPDSKQVCENGQCVNPPQCKFDKDCPGEQVCIKGKCVTPTCKKQEDCSNGQLCFDGECAQDPCEGKTCPDGQFCKGGQCVGSCAGVFCPTGEKCIDGTCTQDPCADKKCAADEKCVNGTCTKDPCEGDSCRHGRICLPEGRCAEEPCKGVKCPDSQTCKEAQCTGDRKCKLDIECPGDAICVNGVCADKGCYDQSCADGELCLNGKCTKNACDGKKCADGETCRPVDGQCVKNCPTCPTGERCVDGACQADPCKDVTCQDGERCEEGKCVADACKTPNGKPCKYTRACKGEKCDDDPCAGIKCAEEQTCRDGVCYGKKVTPTEPTDETQSEASAEPAPEPIEVTVDGGAKETAYREYLASGGCGCEVTSNTGSNMGFLFLLLCLGFVITRRRKA